MILCILHKWLWSRAYDSDRTTPDFTKKHILKCESCRSVTDSMRSLDDSLALDCAAPTEDWHSAVMREVRCTPPPLKQPARVTHPYRLALAGVAAVFAVVCIIKTTAPRDGEIEKSVEISHKDQVVPLTELAFSLENESAALSEDVRYAARMATSCLPF